LTFVLNASRAWCFEDERAEDAWRLQQQPRSDDAVVPSIWPAEVANSLPVAERRWRLPHSDIDTYVRLQTSLPIVVEDGDMVSTLNRVRSLARERNLSAYDAPYLDMAVTRSLPLATLDARLRFAATALGITTLSTGPGS
jgi:predicted nucleic acid-binding protein